MEICRFAADLPLVSGLMPPWSTLLQSITPVLGGEAFVGHTLDAIGANVVLNDLDSHRVGQVSGELEHAPEEP